MKPLFLCTLPNKMNLYYLPKVGYVATDGKVDRKRPVFLFVIIGILMMMMYGNISYDIKLENPVLTVLVFAGIGILLEEVYFAYKKKRVQKALLSSRKMHFSKNTTANLIRSVKSDYILEVVGFFVISGALLLYIYWGIFSLDKQNSAMITTTVFLFWSNVRENSLLEKRKFLNRTEKNKKKSRQVTQEV